MSKKRYEGGGEMDDAGSLIMGDSGPFAGASGGAGAASPGAGMSAMERLMSGLKGNAKYFAAGALLGGTQGVKGALMAPIMASMMQKKGTRAPIPGMTSTGAPDMAGPGAIPTRMLQEARNAGPPMPGGDSVGPTAYKKGGPVRRAMGGPAMPVAPIPAPAMAVAPRPVAAMKTGGSVKKASGGLTGLTGIGGIKDKFMSMQDKNKMPLKKHNYPAIRKPEIGRAVAVKPEMEMKKGGTMDKSEFKKAIKKAAGGCMETERKAMGGPIRQKHEMAMGKSIPTKQEPPSGTQRRWMGGSVDDNKITSGKVKGWGSSRNTGGGKVC